MTIINAVKKERKGKERKGKERKGKERKGKERKGKERKGKGLLYLIGISVLISIVFIACNKRPTASNDFAEIDKDLPTSSSGSGNNTVTTTTISTANNIDSPVVVVSGNNLIIAYREGNNINYRTSGDGGKSFSTAMTLSSSAKYPYIFFDGSKVSVMVTKNGGKTGFSTKVITEINGTFQLNNNGAYEISGKSEAGLSGVVGVDSMGGEVGGTIEAAKYFGKQTTIRTAAGAGIGIGNSRQIPLSEVGGTTYLILEAKQLTGAQSGWGWDLKAGSKQTTKGNNDVIKIAKDGSTFKTSEAAEKSESYSIKANGQITGITSSPTVGNNTKDASIAADGKGNIYTLTIEDGGLKFRKFSVNISGNTIN